MNKAIEYADKHFPEFLDQLKSLVRIPSVSFPGFPPEMVRRSAEAVATLLKQEGLENVELLEIPGAPPYVYADWLHAPGQPTLLLYAHHDVQPPMREAVWKTPPFEPVEKDGRLYGRGAADDKAGIIVHSAAIRSILKTEGKLPVNVKLLIEGEEEVGSKHLEHLLAQFKDKLQSDVMILTDTGNFDTGIPTVTTSLRGLVGVQVEVRALKSPVHSGMWGGPAPDPALALSKMLAELVDDEGRINIPGIYDEVLPLTDVELDSVNSLQYSDAEFRKQAGMLEGTQILGGRTPALIKMTRLPALTVNAIQVSSRAGAANVIMDAAWARVTLRIVPKMDPEETLQKLIGFLKEKAPWGVEVHILDTSKGGWWLTQPSGPIFEKTSRALSKAFGRDTVYLGSGGSIPFVGAFAAVLKAPALLIGVEDPYTNAHSENESLHLGDLKKSIHGAIYLYEEIAKG